MEETKEDRLPACDSKKGNKEGRLPACDTTACDKSCKKGKIIVFSAPSGTGKSTIISRLLAGGDIDMQFSVSATSRQPREGEVNGVNYHFLTPESFREIIDADGFVEWEEVYDGRYYGTLKSEIERICGEGHNVVLDIDVKGAVNVKRLYGDRALLVFIQPPSIDALRERLVSRGTETPESLALRLGKAEFELGYAPQFDTVVVNDQLDQAVADAHDVITEFLNT